MAKLLVLKYLLVFYLHLVLCSKLSRLEKRVDIMELKMFNDAMMFKADITDIFEKLDNILENSSIVDMEFRPTVSTNPDENEANNVLMLVKKTLNEEKKYTRNVVKTLRNELLRKIEWHMSPKKINDVLFDQFLSLDLRINSTQLKISKNMEDMSDIVITHNSKYRELQNSIELVNMELNKVKNVEQSLKALDKTKDFLSARINCHSKSWHSFGQSCYHIENRDPQTWIKANEKCRLLNASLAEVESKEENSFLVELASIMTSDDELYGVYLGGSDLGKEGEWIWEGSKRKIFDVFNNFNGNEPNGGRRENCLHLIRKYFWNWNDIPCENRLSYICEKKLNY